MIVMNSLLSEPVPDDALEASIAEKFRDDKKAYELEARRVTKQYAMGK